MKIYALLPSLEDQIGHIFEYHMAVSKAAEVNQWKYFALVPRNCRIKSLPKNWIRCLYVDSWKDPSMFQRLKALLLNVFPLYRLIRKRQTGDAVFLEHRVYYLLPMLLFFFFKKPKCQFWIFHRYDFSKHYLKTLLFSTIHRFLFWKVGRENVKFFTDSELLKKAQEELFNIKVCVLPIPHTEILTNQTNHLPDRHFLWWPGGSTRKEKGLENMIRLASQIREAKSNFTLVIADSAKEKFSRKEEIQFVSSDLSRQEYCSWMTLSEVILLPYLPSQYSHRTSGIFIEAIIYGKLVVTTPDTWMSYELRRYQLEELAFDWYCPNLPKKLQNFIEDLNLRKKLKVMQKSYQNYHNEQNFACLMKQAARKGS